MRRLLIVLAVLSVFGFEAHAQVYAKFYAGYSMPMAGMSFIEPSSSLYSVMVYPMYSYDRQESISNYKQHFVSLGKGIDIKGAVGMNFNKTLGAEVDFGFLMGGKLSATQSSKITIAGFLLNSQSTYTYQANMVQVSPMIVLNSDVNFANVFVKFGPVLNMGTINAEEMTNNNGQVVDRAVKFTGGLSMGMSSALGASFALSDNLSLFAEFQVMTLAHAPAKAHVVKYEVNGSDQLGNLKVEDREFVFVSKYSEDESADHPDDQPTQLLKFRFPMSNMGLHVGVRMSF